MNAKDPQTYAIFGAAMEVHRVLGCGFLEAVYPEALAMELTIRGVPFHREVPIPVMYKGSMLSVGYRADSICFNRVLVELKAISKLGSVEDAQILNYLKASDLPVSLLLNFGGRSLECKRMVGEANAVFESVESVESVDKTFSYKSVDE